MWGDGPVLVVAPHPDDEVLGPGATVARLADEGRDVYVLIVTKADPSIFPDYSIEEGRREAVEADGVLGVRKTIFLEDFPAALLDTIPQSTLNRAVGEVVDQVAPDAVLIPFPGDLHVDHRRVAEAALVAARPTGDRRPPAIVAYETLSETNWNAAHASPPFVPNAFVDCSAFLGTKIHAMKRYASQVKPFPHERSLEAIRALAASRGAAVGVRAAEAFLLVRDVL